MHLLVVIQEFIPPIVCTELGGPGQAFLPDVLLRMRVSATCADDNILGSLPVITMFATRYVNRLVGLRNRAAALNSPKAKRHSIILHVTAAHANVGPPTG